MEAICVVSVYVFCNQGINSNYLHQSRLFIWAPHTHMQSAGQRSHFHPHISFHYFQPNFQDVKGLMWCWIHKGKAEAWIWKRSRLPHAHTCTDTHQCLASRKPPTQTSCRSSAGGDGHWAAWPHPPSCTIHDDLSTATSSSIPNTHFHASQSSWTPPTCGPSAAHAGAFNATALSVLVMRKRRKQEDGLNNGRM